jgi:hypothetical protein
MKQLDEHTRTMLLAVDDPPVGMQERIYRAITVAGGPPEGSGGDPGTGGPGFGGPMDVVFAAKVVGATIGMTSAGVALLALTSMGIRAMNPVEPTRDRVTVVDRSADEPGSATAAVEAAPLELESSTVATEPTSPIPDRQSIATSPSEPQSVASASTLEAELALIQDARAAESPSKRLAALEQHRDEFRDGVLADEREVMRIEALCALGRVDQAEQAAALFVAAKPAHPLRSRVEPACPN